MSLENTIKPTFLNRIVDKTNKCVFDCYVCLSCPCLTISLIKFIRRDSR